jgi:drug/metabolite transporter (DMT)-like permease
MRALIWLYGQPYLLLFLTTLFWAGNAVAGKLAIGHVSPFLLTFLRWFIASIIVAPVAYKYLCKDWAIVRSKIIFLFALGSLGFSVFNNLLYNAVHSTTAINVAIIQAALPASIFVLNYLFFRTRVSKYQLFGFPITIVGVLAIVSRGEWQVLSQMSFVVGDVLILLAMTFYGLYSVMLSKKPTIHWLSLISVMAISAALTSLPFVVIETINGSLVRPDQFGWAVVLYTAVCASLLSQVFWIRGIELIGSNAASLFINLVPILGTLLAIVLLDETPDWYHMLGLGLIIGGIVLAQKKVATVAS